MTNTTIRTIIPAEVFRPLLATWRAGQTGSDLLLQFIHQDDRDEVAYLLGGIYEQDITVHWPQESTYHWFKLTS